MIHRPSLDETFMEVAKTFSKRSTCYRRQVGAVLVSNGVLVSEGYNGNPSGEPHCTICPREGLASGERLELCTAVHADMNALLRGSGDTLYIYGGTPCNNCVSVIIQKGVKRVVCRGSYPHEDAVDRLVKAGVLVDYMGE